MDFNNFVGNESVKSQVISLFENNKISHAMMIEGAKGLGKRTFAKIIAQAIVCENPSGGFACNKCLNCKKAEKEIHPDIIYPEKSGVLQGYSITTVRKIREDTYIIPNEASKKVYIFTDIDNMSIPAQNALLKVLEEPPKNVVLILTCTSASSILPTIRSRAQIFSLKPVSTNDIITFLHTNYAENYKENGVEKVKQIANASNGNIGIAVDFLISSDFGELIDITNKLAKSIVNRKEFDILSLTAKISENRQIFSFILGFLKSFLRDSLVYSFASEDLSSHNEMVINLSENLSTKQILNLIDVTDKSKDYLDKNVNLSILSSYFCSNLHRIASMD